MIVYTTTIELAVAPLTVTVFGVEIEIIEDDSTDADWCFGEFRVEGVNDELDTAMIAVPAGHILEKVITDALLQPRHFNRIEDMWAEYRAGEREAARFNAVERKLDSQRAGL